MLKKDKNLKLYYSVSEVAEMFGVNESLLRFWEKEFPQIAPKKVGRGIRQYSKEDINTLKLIYHLVKERGMTIDGARKALKVRRSDTATPREVELLERLQRLRAMLVQVREELGGEIGEQMVDDDIAPEAEIRPTAAVVEPLPTEPVAKRAVKAFQRAETPASQRVLTEKQSQRQPKAEPTKQKPEPKAERQPQPMEERMDLPFYEQTLF